MTRNKEVKSSENGLPKGFLEIYNHYERREFIRKNWKPRYLVQRYNRLVESLILKGEVSANDRFMLLSMEQEGITYGGIHYGKIAPEGTASILNHDFGLSKYNQYTGQVDVIIGYRKAQTWKLLNSKKERLKV